MKYDFETLSDRKSTYSMKWDVSENVLPMWVADMDFKTAPEILEAVVDRANKGIFGYQNIPDEWYRAYMGWWSRRYGFDIEKEWLIFSTGVIPSISSIVRKLTTPAEKVLIQTPVYNVFFNSILNNGRQVLESPLLFDGNAYSMDFTDLEEKLSDPQTTLMILCNPHNPVGKLWDRDTLQKVGELCKKYDVTVISDEIHCDLTVPGKSYVPFASVSDVCRDISISCVAPTKSFNLAGLQTSAVVIPDKTLRHKVWRGLNTDEVAEPNSFAVVAAIAAYEKGEEWLEELREYIQENRVCVSEYLKANIPEIKLISADATYLLWLDCSSLTDNAANFARSLRRDFGLFLSRGGVYGKPGDSFLRMNIACPRSLVEEGLKRLNEGVRKF
jgi:cystathionine beta-lyase